MTEKPKRKNAPPTPKAYWWIFGTLALVLLIGLWYPIRLVAPYIFNVVLYAVIALPCYLALAYSFDRYIWKRAIVIVMFLCLLLTIWNVILCMFPSNNISTEYCTVEKQGILAKYSCVVESKCSPFLEDATKANYVSVRGLPIAIRYDYETGLGCLY